MGPRTQYIVACREYSYQSFVVGTICAALVAVGAVAPAIGPHRTKAPPAQSEICVEFAPIPQQVYEQLPDRLVWYIGGERWAKLA